MSAQKYHSTVALDRMAQGLCPECGKPSSAHLDDVRFWLPRTCDLLPRGVDERILQYRADLSRAAS